MQIRLPESVYRCGICGRESYDYDEITPCLRSHTKADLLFVYRTGGYVPMVLS